MKTSSKQALISFKDVSIVSKSGLKLEKMNFEIPASGILCIYGPNGSGKGLISGLIDGSLKPASGELIRSAEITRSSVVTVSQAEQKKIMDYERYFDDSEFMQGATDPGRSVRKIILENITEDGRIAFEELSEKLGMEKILGRGLRFLSTGEFRKTMILRGACSSPEILILDDPCTGLDITSREELHSLIPHLLDYVRTVIIFTGRSHDIPECADRILRIENSTVSVVDDRSGLTVKSSEIRKDGLEALIDNSAEKTDSQKTSELISMTNVNLSYYEVPILKDINWSVKAGEHWKLSGPNGSGKTTLLSLINGDNPKAYGQDIYLFGRKKGSGESIWDLKKEIGVVSGALQHSYRIRQTVMEVIMSGFFDTIGLYDKPELHQREMAEKWCRGLGIIEYRDREFPGLSAGIARVALIARAMVKKPELLIFDEPCQGLDDENSRFILDAAEAIISSRHSTLLYVSHDTDFQLKGITHNLQLVPHPDGGSTCEISMN